MSIAMSNSKTARPVSVTGGLLISLMFAINIAAYSQTARKQPASGRTGSLKVITGQAGSVVFINHVRHGATGVGGEVDIPRVMAGSYQARVRTAGFTDWTGPVVITAGAGRTLKVTQQPTSDEVLLRFQKAEQMRDSGKNRDAVKEYEQALVLRPVFPEAHIGMARSFVTLQDFEQAEKQIQAAIKIGGRTLVEARTVLANLRRSQGLVEESVVEYRNALRLARGNSFEAHIGLGIALGEMGKVDEAVREYRVGILQDMETEPILYHQLAEILEKAGRNKEAIEAYRAYLRLDPEGELASAVESIIERLKETLNEPRR
jgi:PEGA domain-containing protein/tetratricopeptide repeat protein